MESRPSCGRQGAVLESDISIIDEEVRPLARKVRVEYEGEIYHLLSRGDRQEASFATAPTGGWGGE